MPHSQAIDGSIPTAGVPVTKIRLAAQNAIAESREFAANFAEISILPAHAISMPADDDLKKHVKSVSNKAATAAADARGNNRGRFDAAWPSAFAIPWEPRRRRCADAGARRPAAVRHRGRGRRLQPRRLGPHRHAGRARRLRPDAVEGRPDARRPPISRRRRPTTSRRMFTRPEAHDVQVTLAVQPARPGQFHAQADRQRQGQHRVLQAARAAARSHCRPAPRCCGASRSSISRSCSTTPARWQSNAKMTNLKTAAHNLLTTLKNAAKSPGDVKVAIVPFATDVNAGTSNVNATWIDWTDWDAANGTCSNNELHHARAAASRTARSGRPSRTAPGTAASTTATRTTTSPTHATVAGRRPRCSAPIRPPTARPR